MPDRTSRTSRRTKAASEGKVRIIGGQWRGRWIRFSDAEGLRPTGDRMRETLFNWLQPYVPGARCLDLFAGTGALGIEAVSRGAAQSVLFERNPSVCEQLENQIRALTANHRDQSAESHRRLSVHPVPAESYLRNPVVADGPFDIVFVDPPFMLDVQISILVSLQHSGVLADEAMIYVEAPANLALETELPPTYEVYRSLRQGNVQCLLLQSIGSHS